ncbi:hypothetical protein F5Y04DRAFT_283920 [Hypomontagnella monticulosa]|nr:hypothetical protein F5Y04DRAFT_283920 [Hypomontagnella monticulosa]
MPIPCAKKGAVPKALISDTKSESSSSEDTKPDNTEFEKTVFESTIKCSGQIRYEPLMNKGRTLGQRITCLCGSCAGIVAGHFPIHRVCHCHDCKKLNGGNPGNYLVVPRSNIGFDWRAPLASYNIRHPGREERHNKMVLYCKNCAFTLFWKHANLGTEMVFVFAGTLVDPNWLMTRKPDQETYLQTKSWPVKGDGWYSAPEELEEPKTDVDDQETDGSSESSQSFTYRKKGPRPSDDTLI